MGIKHGSTVMVVFSIRKNGDTMRFSDAVSVIFFVSYFFMPCYDPRPAHTFCLQAFDTSRLTSGRYVDWYSSELFGSVQYKVYTGKEICCEIVIKQISNRFSLILCILSIIMRLVLFSIYSSVFIIVTSSLIDVVPNALVSDSTITNLDDQPERPNVAGQQASTQFDSTAPIALNNEIPTILSNSHSNGDSIIQTVPDNNQHSTTEADSLNNGDPTIQASLDVQSDSSIIAMGQGTVNQ